MPRTLPVALLPLLVAACSEKGSSSDPDAPVTFNREVAPIVFENCSPCHHPGEAAPFSLLSYADVEKRAKQIGLVTRSRFMPPWLPEAGHVPFRDDRSLTDDELETLTRWLEADCPEGDPGDLPPQPEWKRDWLLGEPDLVASMPEPYTVPAEGRDVYRNFVIPAPVDETRWVRTVEYRPGNRVVLHHSILFVDGSGTSRQLDAQDPEPGYGGMELGVPRIPDGQFIGWTPGKVPLAGTDDVAWRLTKDTDIVLQLHLRPSGKPEPIQVSLGLHFAEKPPTRNPMAIRIWSRDIDIPAGESAYVVESTYELPVDVQVLGVYPHAHYLGKDLKGYATFPDGTEQMLVRMPDWDFNWQEEYFYRDPLFLPKGTVLSIHYTFDNTAENPFNPNVPPKRVIHGYQSDDEMAELLLMVLPEEEDRPILFNDFIQYSREVDLAWMQRLAGEQENSVAYNHQLATYCLRVGRTAEAIAYYDELVELHPDRANPLQRRGQARIAHGDLDGAVKDLEGALELDPYHLRATVYLGRAYQLQGRQDEAREKLERALSFDLENLPAHTFLGEILAERGEEEEAARHFERALERNPEHARALWGLARVRLEQEEADEAIRLSKEALHVAPDAAGAHHVLGLALEAQGKHEEAGWHLSLARRFDPDEPAYRRGAEHTPDGAGGAR